MKSICHKCKVNTSEGMWVEKEGTRNIYPHIVEKVWECENCIMLGMDEINYDMHKRRI